MVAVVDVRRTRAFRPGLAAAALAWTAAVVACGSSGGDAQLGGGGPGRTPTGPVGDARPVGGWTERILHEDGSIDWNAWLDVARRYHEEDIVDYRLGPKRTDYANPRTQNEVYQPEPNGLWKGGTDRALADAFCKTSDGLPRNEREEQALYDGGGGWIESGQLVFSPKPGAPGYADEFRFGVANVRNFDGAMARKFDERGELVTRALCMRMRAEWTPDWWNRNSISTPASPSVVDAKRAIPDLPLPAVATARGGAQASVSGFLAFQNGLILAAGTGNDPYTGFGTPVPYPAVRLDPGKVPTALAVTPSNEFVLATVWDTTAKRAQVAVIAAGSIGQPATVPDGWGVPSWPTVTHLKVLGYIDLPFVAPMQIGVTISKPAVTFRGTDVVEEGAKLGTQAQRDAYRALPWDAWRDEELHKLLAHTGYAIVSSRAENKVAFIDLGPLFRFYREMYLTSQSKYEATRRPRQGDAPNEWPYTFAHEPSQRPVVLGTIDVPRPTAVLARQRLKGTTNRAPLADLNVSSRNALVASMDGTVRLFDVSALMDPTKTPALPGAPLATARVGENPLQIAQPIAGDFARDDLFVVSRGRAAIHVFDYKLAPIDVLEDARLTDPVFVAIGTNGAGYGGSGRDYALFARVLTVLDHDGMQVVDYGMKAGDREDVNKQHEEEWPYVDAKGNPVRFHLGYANPLPGKPFMLSFDEVI